MTATDLFRKALRDVQARTARQAAESAAVEVRAAEERGRREVLSYIGEAFVKSVVGGTVPAFSRHPDALPALDPVSALIAQPALATPADRLAREAKSLGLSPQLADLIEGASRGHPADVWAYGDLLAACEDEWGTERFTKADRSHLVRKVIQNKLGRRQVVWVKPQDADKADRGVPVGEGGKPTKPQPVAKTREQLVESRTVLANAVSNPGKLNPEQVRNLADHIDAITKDEAKGLLKQLGQKVSGDQMAVAGRLLEAIRAGRDEGRATGAALAEGREPGDHLPTHADVKSARAAVEAAGGAGKAPLATADALRQAESRHRQAMRADLRRTAKDEPLAQPTATRGKPELTGPTPRVVNWARGERKKVLDQFAGTELEGAAQDYFDKLTTADAVLKDKDRHAAKIRQAGERGPKLLTADEMARWQPAGEFDTRAEAEAAGAKGVAQSGGKWYAMNPRDAAAAEEKRLSDDEKSSDIVKRFDLAKARANAAGQLTVTPDQSRKVQAAIDSLQEGVVDGRGLPGMVPIHAVRAAVAKSHPEITPEQFDAVILGMRRRGSGSTHNVVSIDDRSRATTEQLLDGVHAVGEQFFYLEPKDRTGPRATAPAEFDARMDALDPRDSGQVDVPAKTRPPATDDRDVERFDAATDKLARMEGWQADRPSVAADNAVAGARERLRGVVGEEGVGEVARSPGEVAEKKPVTPEPAKPTEGMDTNKPTADTQKRISQIRARLAQADDLDGPGVSGGEQIALMKELDELTGKTPAQPAPADHRARAATHRQTAAGLESVARDASAEGDREAARLNAVAARASREAANTHDEVATVKRLQDREREALTADQERRRKEAEAKVGDTAGRLDEARAKEEAAKKRVEELRAASAPAQSPTTGVDKPTVVGDTTPVQPQSAGAKTGGGGMSTTTELKPLVGSSEKQISFAAENRGKVVGEAERRLADMVQDFDADIADTAYPVSDAQIQVRRGRIEDMRAGIEYLKTRAVSAPAWLDYGRHYYGHTLAMAIGAWINRQDRSAIEPYRAFINVSEKAAGAA